MAGALLLWGHFHPLQFAETPSENVSPPSPAPRAEHGTAKPSLSSPQSRQGPWQPPPAHRHRSRAFGAHSQPAATLSCSLQSLPREPVQTIRSSLSQTHTWTRTSLLQTTQVVGKQQNKDVVVFFYTAHMCSCPALTVTSPRWWHMRGTILEPLGHLSLKGKGANPASGHSVKGGMKAGVALPSGRIRRFHGSKCLASPSARDPPNPVSFQGGVWVAQQGTNPSLSSLPATPGITKITRTLQKCRVPTPAKGEEASCISLNTGRNLLREGEKPTAFKKSIKKRQMR